MPELNIFYRIGGTTQSSVVAGFSAHPANDLENNGNSQELKTALGVDSKTPILVCIPGGLQ